MFFLFSHLMQHNRYISFFGIVAILGIAFLFSASKKKIKLKLVLNALVMQFLLAFFILKTEIGVNVFGFLARGFEKLYGFADEGSRFLFGSLTNTSGPWGPIFALKVVTIIIFFGALMSVLFHFGIVQFFVKIVAFLIRPILGTSGAETLCAAANSMLGQTEAPLLIRKYLKSMTESEILLVMVSGMATLSGAILAVYGSMNVPMLHLLSASVMSIPGAILMAKILIPEQGVPVTLGSKSVAMKKDTTSVLDAVASGTTDGMKLAANVAAMLITFIGLIALLNFSLEFISYNAFGVKYSLDMLFAKVFSWIAFLLGVPFKDKNAAGALLGQKLVINEFIAYSNMVKTELSLRAKAILTYALCGFANFSSIGIQIGGLGALVPEKRSVLVRLGLTAVLGATLANFLNAAIAALFI